MAAAKEGLNLQLPIMLRQLISFAQHNNLRSQLTLVWTLDGTSQNGYIPLFITVAGIGFFTGPAISFIVGR